MKRGVAVRVTAVAATVAAMFGSSITSAAFGSSLTKAPRAAATPASLLSASLVWELNHASRHRQGEIFRTLTPIQQLAVETPAPGPFKVVAASGPSVSDVENLLGRGVLTGNDLGQVGSAGKKCANTARTGDWTLPVDSIVGVHMYDWHLDTNWHGNCQTITSDDYHLAYPTNIAFWETYQGKLADVMAGAGSPQGQAFGQGHFATCIDLFFFNNCFNSTAPYIHESFNAWGGSTATGGA